jgi:hypothetical protein
MLDHSYERHRITEERSVWKRLRRHINLKCEILVLKKDISVEGHEIQKRFPV